MKMEQFLPWTIVRLGVKEHESEVSFTDRAHLKNLGIGKQIPLLHSDFKLVNPWVKEEQLRHQLAAEVPRCLPSGKEPPRTEAKDETMERYGCRRARF